MFKLAGSVIDCYDDPKFMSSHQVQAFIGREIVDSASLEKLADRDFAVKITDGNVTVRKFPVYNEFITKISCAYAVDSWNQLPSDIQKVAAARLSAACRRYGLGVPAVLEDSEKTAGYHVVIKHTTAKPEIRETDELAKEACWQAAKQLDRMTPEDRVVMAYNLEKVGAAHLRQDVYDYVPKDKYGPNLEQEIKNRAYILKSAEDLTSKALLTTLEDLYSSRNSKTPIEFAVSLAEFDKIAGFRQRYRGGMTDAYKATFGGTKHNQAEAARSKVEHGEYKGSDEPTPVDTQTGSEMPKEAAEQLSISEHMEMLSQRFPRGSKEYQNQMSKTASLSFGEKFKIAWHMFFGV